MQIKDRLVISEVNKGIETINGFLSGPDKVPTERSKSILAGSWKFSTLEIEVFTIPKWNSRHSFKIFNNEKSNSINDIFYFEWKHQNLMFVFELFKLP